MTREITIGGSKYIIQCGEQEVSAVFNKVVDWMQNPKHYAAHSGEGIMQDDNCQIDAPELISDIIDDIIQPKYVEGQD